MDSRWLYQSSCRRIRQIVEANIGQDPENAEPCFFCPIPITPGLRHTTHRAAARHVRSRSRQKPATISRPLRAAPR